MGPDSTVAAAKPGSMAESGGLTTDVHASSARPSTMVDAVYE